LAVEGIESAIERAKEYYKAGADMIFVEAPENMEHIRLIARELKGIPLLFNWAEGGKTPPVDLNTLRELGFKIVIFPISTLLKCNQSNDKSIRDNKKGWNTNKRNERTIPI